MNKREERKTEKTTGKASERNWSELGYDPHELRYISSKSANKVTIRVPVIPGFNFNENTLREIFMLAKENRIKCVHLLPYHTLGKDKYEQLGLTILIPREQMLAKEELFPFKEMGEKNGFGKYESEDKLLPIK